MACVVEYTCIVFPNCWGKKGEYNKVVTPMTNKTITLSQLVCLHVPSTEIKTSTCSGTCVFCGESSECGFPAELKKTFTAYAYLQMGDIICPECYYVYTTQKYRLSMWVVSKDEFRFFKKAEAYDIVMNPPSPPFGIYLTKTWKKQGWIVIMNKVNYTRDCFFVGLDYNVIFVNLELLQEYITLIKYLRKQKISKQELETGNLSVKSIEKIDMNLELMKQIQNYAGDPLWGLGVYIVK